MAIWLGKLLLIYCDPPHTWSFQSIVAKKIPSWQNNKLSFHWANYFKRCECYSHFSFCSKKENYDRLKDFPRFITLPKQRKIMIISHIFVITCKNEISSRNCTISPLQFVNCSVSICFSFLKSSHVLFKILKSGKKKKSKWLSGEMGKVFLHMECNSFN